MIQQKTVLNVIDNSGIKFVRCVQNKKNDSLLVSVFGKRLKTNIKKGGLFSAIVVRLKEVKSKNNGTFIFFDENSVVLLNSKKNLVGTRFFGPISSKLRRKKLLKILCLTLTLF